MHPRILQGNIVEKILRDREGRLARVNFYVYENEGRLKARILKIEYIDEKISAGLVLSLNGSIDDSNVSPQSNVVVDAVISPFFDSSLIYTIGSKPRAPSKN